MHVGSYMLRNQYFSTTQNIMHFRLSIMPWLAFIFIAFRIFHQEICQTYLNKVRGFLPLHRQHQFKTGRKEVPVPYLVVRVFPEVQSEQLERSEHGPAKMVKPCEAIVGVFTDATKACVVAGTVPETYHKRQWKWMVCSNSYWMFNAQSSTTASPNQTTSPPRTWIVRKSYFSIPELFPDLETVLPYQVTAQLHTQFERRKFQVYHPLFWFPFFCLFFCFLNSPSAGYFLTIITKFLGFPRPLLKTPCFPNLEKANAFFSFLLI